MKKKLFFKLFIFAVIGTFVTFTSCEEYGDDIDDLQSQINTLKTTVDAVNAAVESGAVITNVSSTASGITVTLSNNQSYSITNGADGSVVTIGTNGNWYIDGVDTGLAAQGPAGADGKDGDYYYPNEDGFWYKVDGETGAEEATTQQWLPEGTITAVYDSVTGFVTLYNVEGADGPFTLGKGELAGLLFAPNTMEDGVGVVDLGYINGTLGTTTVKSTFQTNLKLNFRFNPSSADVSLTTWDFIGNSVKFRAASTTDDADIFAVSSFTEKSGWGEFGLQVTGWEEPVTDEDRVIALQGTTPQGEQTKVVTSDYVKVVPVEYTATISNAKLDPFTDYRTDAPAIEDPLDHELPYTAKDLELLDYVWATATHASVKKKFEDYGFTDYKFEFSTDANYDGHDGVTDQNDFVTLNGSKLTVTQDTAAIDRTPLIKVTLKSSLNDAILTTGYIKFKIVESAMPESFGVNLAGAEFGKIPGRYGYDYIYPSAKDLDYFKSKNLMLIRLPFKWERIQFELNGPLIQEELNRMKAFVSEAEMRDMLVILDMHNYGRRSDGGISRVIGSGPELTKEHLADVWQKIASELKSYSNIWGYGIMNEPHDMPTPGSWFEIAQETINAIRQVDTKTAIVVGGNGWSSAWRWVESSDNLKNLHDPAGNLIFEAHAYFDQDASGTYKGSYDEENGYPQKGVDKVRPFIDWLRQYNKKGFVGEYGIPDDDPRWNTVLENFLIYLRDNGVPGTYWAAGPWWGNYPLSVQPTNNYTTDRPQMEVLEKYPKTDPK